MRENFQVLQYKKKKIKAKAGSTNTDGGTGLRVLLSVECSTAFLI